MSENMNSKAGAALPASDGSETCWICKWTNVSLLNLGRVGEPRWTCHGCCKRILDATLATLDENKHLADGDECTLIRLKRAVSPNAEMSGAEKKI